MDDGSSWRKVAGVLAGRFRVVRVVRRQCRADLPPLEPCSMDAEVDTVLTVAANLTEPMIIVGHSSGGVVALETLLAAPSKFAGAVLYEPPAATGDDTAHDEIFARIRAAVNEDKPGKAMQIFVHEIVGMPASAGLALRAVMAGSAKLRALAPRQLSDLDGLGVRLGGYASIEVPVLLLGGDRSPAHLGDKLGALADTLPDAGRLVMAGWDHGAQAKAPTEVASAITTFARQVLAGSGTGRASST
jgi:pimeloyl-ACP methyl ester carboxylesterase